MGTRARCSNYTTICFQQAQIEIKIKKKYVRSFRTLNPSWAANSRTYNSNFKRTLCCVDWLIDWFIFVYSTYVRFWHRLFKGGGIYFEVYPTGEEAPAHLQIKTLCHFDRVPGTSTVPAAQSSSLRWNLLCRKLNYRLFLDNSKYHHRLKTKLLHPMQRQSNFNSHGTINTDVLFRTIMPIVRFNQKSPSYQGNFVNNRYLG